MPYPRPPEAAPPALASLVVASPVAAPSVAAPSYPFLSRVPLPSRRSRHRAGRTSRGQRPMLAAGLALLATGAIVAATTGSPVIIPPTPPAPGADNPSVANAVPIAVTPAASTCPVPKAQSSASSVPVRVCIPAIGVNASVIQLGINPDHTVQVPSLKQVADAAWDKDSPLPGTDGPAIILGHIDSAKYGQGVFFNLGRLHAGDAINVARGDGAVATFHVLRVAEYPKSAFPSKTVYGDTPGATIRLITCGGRFDASIGSYVDNIVVYGALTSVS
jgi:hypothetical protein